MRTLLGALDPFGKFEQIVMRMSFVLPSLRQVGCLSGLIIIGPGSNYAYFIYSNEDAEEILSFHQRVPITVWGRILRIERAENSRAIIKELTQRCPVLEVCTTHRTCSGSVGYLHVSLGPLSQIR